MQSKYLWIIFPTILSLSHLSFAQDHMEIDKMIIKGNSELPKILYVVPWKDPEGKALNEQKLRLHSLFGELYEPLAPEAPAIELTFGQ